MNTTEDALKERIKELTCLYEVSSIIVNADVEQFHETLKAIAFSLKKGFQYPEQTEIEIQTSICTIKTDIIDPTINLVSDIQVFNKPNGSITASLRDNRSTFLKEEKQLLDSVALKIGNLIERIEIQKNETSLKRQMEHADRLGILGEITAGIAHELNTPLANILGFAELLKDDFKDEVVIGLNLEKGKKTISVGGVFPERMSVHDAYSNTDVTVENGNVILDNEFNMVLLEGIRASK